MMNHSCDPNCAHYYIVEQGKSPRLIMRAIKDIKSQEELVYSYVHLYDSKLSRQEKLTGAYGFACSCSRCSQSDDSFPQDLEIYPKIEALPRSCKVSNEIITCESLIYQDLSISPRIYKKLLTLVTSSEKLATFSPCHKMLLNAYTLISRCGLHFAKTVEDETQLLDICKHCIYFSLLSVGLVHHFTKFQSIELVPVLQALSNFLHICSQKRFFMVKSVGVEGFLETLRMLVSTRPTGFVFAESAIVQSAIDITILEMQRFANAGEEAHEIVRNYYIHILKNCRGHELEAGHVPPLISDMM
jgi:SET domain